MCVRDTELGISQTALVLVKLAQMRNTLNGRCRIPASPLAQLVPTAQSDLPPDTHVQFASQLFETCLQKHFLRRNHGRDDPSNQLY